MSFQRKRSRKKKQETREKLVCQMDTQGTEEASSFREKDPLAQENRVTERGYFPHDGKRRHRLK